MRAWYFIPVLTGAALAATAYMWNAEKNRWQPPAARLPQLPALVQLPAIETASTAQALARPVLWSTRRPVLKKEAKDNQRQEFMQSRLQAVFEAGAESIAVLKRPDGSTYKVTPQTQPWRIQSFDGHTASFVSSDGTQRATHTLQHAKP